jgi:hypothetical protein
MEKDKKQEVENHQLLRYQYYLNTWGGFYNDEYKLVHGKDEGSYWFDTAEQRESYISELRDIVEKLNARSLAISISEGYHTAIHTKLHRVIEWDGKRYYSECDMGIGCDFGPAQYHIEYKWRPGFNDYPLGTEFDYDKVKVIEEWITGAFSVKD